MSKKKTKRCSTLCRSQRAHLRLNEKYLYLSIHPGNEHLRPKATYHAEVFGIQEASGKILSYSERKKIFRRIKNR